MRYLAPPFILGALKRGCTVEQFLGPVPNSQRPGILYTQIQPHHGTYQIYLHAALDSGPFTCDLDTLPRLFDGDEEDFGHLVATAHHPSTALDIAEARTAAVRDRWVNHSMAGDEYSDYVLAGRPNTAPDARPWPTTQPHQPPTLTPLHRPHE